MPGAPTLDLGCEGRSEPLSLGRVDLGGGGVRYVDAVRHREGLALGGRTSY